MTRNDLEDLKTRVPCAALLGRAGFVVDRKESTRRAVKWRRGGEIIIVTHEGRGWFDPLSDAKGDVFSLGMHLEGGGFTGAAELVASLSGFVPFDAFHSYAVRPPVPARIPQPAETFIPAERWQARVVPSPGSPAWSYLRFHRDLPVMVLRVAIQQGCLREGPYGSAWMAHTDDDGEITGWEARGPQWRGFASGGTKILFRLGAMDGTRFCVTEAAIDAMSLAAIEGMRDGTLYLSTGGGWSPATDTALRRLATRPDAQIVAATDANSQGDLYAARLRLLAEDAGCDWIRLRPTADDWNAVLSQRAKEREAFRRSPLSAATAR